MLSERAGESSALARIGGRIARGVINFFSTKERYEIVMGDKILAMYEEIAERKGVRVGTLIPRALASYVWLQRELKPDEIHPEKHLVLRSPNSVREIRLP